MQRGFFALISSLGIFGCTTEFDPALLDKKATCTGCVDLSLGTTHTAAFDGNGRLWLWGLNKTGAIGVPSTVIEQDTPAALVVEGVEWTFAGIGVDQSCAIDRTGALYCWGRNDDGEAGLGSFSPGPTPTQVGTETDWIAVDGGRAFSCGLRAPGTLWCWGWASTEFRLGLESQPTDTTTPQQVPGIEDWISLSVGDDHSCAIRRDKSLWCWGANDFGQLGHGGNLPDQVSGGTSYARVSAGGDHTCGIRTDGTLWCWGDNTNGELGFSGSASEPARVDDSTGWVSISAGGKHTCGTRDDGTLLCLGAGDRGQVGTGFLENAPVPTEVLGGGSWSFVAAGTEHSCGVQRDLSLWCWGANGAGQLGIANPTFLPAPGPAIVVLE